jgi:antitoxin (DNA-binding transcriptional repressor) of toxin-antitoxin stability system
VSVSRPAGACVNAQHGSRASIDNVATRGYIEFVKTVGVRELKNRLSEYIRRVRAGEGVLVTDRGEVVAEIGPPGHGGTDASVAPGLLALARRGLVTLASPSLGDVRLYPPLPRKKRRYSATELLNDERGGR